MFAIARKRRLCYGLLTIAVASMFGWLLMFDENHIQVLVLTLLKNDKVISTARLQAASASSRKGLHKNSIQDQRRTSKKNSFVDKSEKFEKFPRKVLIMSLGRSGSSFLGDLFKRNPKAMYLFEPMAAVFFAAIGSQKYENASLELLEQIYNCKTVSDMYLDFLQKYKSFRTKSSALLTFAISCRRAIRKKRSLARLIKRTCEAATSIVTKILSTRFPRGGVWGIKKLMETNENLRIVHLVRDPRRVINSMKSVGWFRGRNFSERVQELCDCVWKNVQYARKDAALSGRYILVVYREMIQNPFATVVRLYDFLEMGSVPDNVFKWIVENTNGTPGKRTLSDAYSTYRNSTEVLHRKVDLTEDEIVVVNKYCSKVIDFLEN